MKKIILNCCICGAEVERSFSVVNPSCFDCKSARCKKSAKLSDLRKKERMIYASRKPKLARS